MIEAKGVRKAYGDRLLMDDATYPWLILVPRRADVWEIYQLAEADRRALGEEVALVSRVLAALTGCDKINVAALGNIVAQLHVHVVARFRNDPAWPAPVWGRSTPQAWGEADLARFTAGLRAGLGNDFRHHPLG